jgi:hypothetical protein
MVANRLNLYALLPAVTLNECNRQDVEEEMYLLICQYLDGTFCKLCQPTSGTI